jgi:chemotaxis signal transduction protein
MATLSSLRSRRFANRVAEATVQLIAFRLRQDWFALPIDAVQRVATVQSGDRSAPGVRISNESGVMVNFVDQQGLTVIDVDRRIFVQAGLLPDRATLSTEPQQDYCFIILQPKEGETFGLSIDSRPQLRRIPQSLITPLSSTHPAYKQLKSVDSIVNQTEDTQPLFLLDPAQLCQA